MIFFLFLSFKYFNNQMPFLSKAVIGQPKFQRLEDEEDNLDIEEKYDRDTTIQGAVSTARMNEYYLCSVEISENSQFSDNYAFGVGLASGSGGSLFLTFSSLMAKGTIFKNNYALIGGGVALLSSQAFFENPTFKSNTAMRYGGGVYFQGVWTIEEEIKQRQVLYHVGGSYEENDATEVGGGICFTSAGCSFLESVVFKTNVAGISGGGLYAAGAPLKLFTCSFLKNYAGTWDGVVALKQNAQNPVISSPRFRARGGGGLCFLSKTSKQLCTSNCFFGGNSANYPATFGSGAGHEMLLDGAVHWISFRDTINGYKELTSIAISTKQWKHGGEAKQEIYLLNDKDNTNVWNDYTANHAYTEMIIDYKEPEREEQSQLTSYVPSPTPFVYEATPITALPYRTTKAQFIPHNFDKFSSPPLPNFVTTDGTPIDTGNDHPSSDKTPTKTEDTNTDDTTIPTKTEEINTDDNDPTIPTKTEETNNDESETSTSSTEESKNDDKPSIPDNSDEGETSSQTAILISIPIIVAAILVVAAILIYLYIFKPKMTRERSEDIDDQPIIPTVLDENMPIASQTNPYWSASTDQNDPFNYTPSNDDDSTPYLSASGDDTSFYMTDEL